MDQAKWPSLLAIAIITTACAGIGDRTSPPAVPGSSPSPSALPAEPTTFTPTPEEMGEGARLALTFPDGSEATVAYPEYLDLAAMGVQPDVDLLWHERWVGAIVFSHGGPTERLLLGAEPARVHILDGQAVEEWPARPRTGRHSETTRWLVFHLASWTVHVPLNSRTDAGEVIHAVHPYETDEGFVAVEVTQPAALAKGYGEAGGAQLAFGDQDPLPDYVRTGQQGLLIDVAPSKCGAFQPSTQILGSSTYGSVCLEGQLFVNGTSFSAPEQSRQKLAEIVKALRLVGLKSAS